MSFKAKILDNIIRDDMLNNPHPTGLKRSADEMRRRAEDKIDRMTNMELLNEIDRVLSVNALRHW